MTRPEPTLDPGDGFRPLQSPGRHAIRHQSSRVRPRRVAAYLLLALVPLFALAGICIQLSSAALNQRIDDDLSGMVDMTAAAVDARMLTLSSVVTSYAMRPSLRLRLAGNATADTHPLQGHLEELRGALVGITVAFVTDPAGRLVDISPPEPASTGRSFATRDWYKGVSSLGRAYVSSAGFATAAEGHVLVTTVAAPVRDQETGGVTGYLGIGYTLAALDAGAASFTQSAGLSITVADQDHVVLASSDPRPGAGPLRLATRTSPALGWAVSVGIPERTALATLRVLRDTIIAITSLLGLILAVGAWLFVRSGRRALSAEQSSRETANLMEDVLAGSAEGIFGIDLDGRILFANPAAATLLGYTPDEMVGSLVHPLIHAHHADGSDYPVADCPVHRVLGTGEPVRVDSEVYWHRDGSPVPIEYWSQPLIEEGRIQGAVVNFRDVSERKRYEGELTHRSLHDSLTGLPNRTLLRDRLKQALSASSRLHTIVAVLFIDLDDFKIINDTHGHSTGDRVLSEVAAHLRSVVRPSDTVARFGGDEFVVLSVDLASAWEATLLGERILATFEAPLALSEADLTITASVGIAVARHGQLPDELLRNADSAMYRAKQQGRARLELYDEEFRTRMSSRLELQVDLRRALELEQFRVVYQPIVSLSDGRVVGVEALLRWDHPVRGTVGPDEFIPIAEETGLIVGIGDWVLKESVRQVARWRTTVAGAGELTVAVNVSARQLLEPNIADALVAVIAETGIDPGAVHLELTESTIMRDVESSIEILRGLKFLGARLSVDDFGTGYSSLSYLKRLPLDTLKVDQSFVSGLGTDPYDSAIVSAVVVLGRALGLDTLAEGVETMAQLSELRALGCDLAQGYLFAKPLRPVELEAYLVTSFTPEPLRPVPTPGALSA